MRGQDDIREKMVVLRLQRIGKKKQPHFRLIAQERAKDPQDRSLEILGWLNPRTKEKQIKKERVEYWLSVGAQCTDTVHNWLVDEGVIKAAKVKTVKISKKRREKIEGKGKEKHTDKTRSAEANDFASKSFDAADKKENGGNKEQKEEKPVEESKKAEKKPTPAEEKKE